jgi:hypothetical protein
MLMTFTTDGATDPTIHTLNYVTNDTSVPWAAYQLLITLDTNAPLTSSSLTDVTVSSPNEDWTFVPPSAELTSAGATGNPSYPYGYTATINYQGGTPIGVGDELDVGYKLSFAGATEYSEIQQMSPSPVPEPGTLALAAAGALILCGIRRRRGR